MYAYNTKYIFVHFNIYAYTFRNNECIIFVLKIKIQHESLFKLCGCY